MTVPAYGGCLWPVDAACFTDEWDALDPTVQDRSLGLASSTLQRLVGNRVGECPITVRPCKPALCRPFTFQPWATGGFYPFIDGSGRWINSCGHHTCDCDVACRVVLPAPVGRIEEVRVDGSAVPAGEYRVDDGNVLVWQGAGDCPWPATQDVRLPDTEPGTFSITYLNAYPVDSTGAYAAAVLAMEYAKACTGSRTCRLPSGVTTIVRQGIALEIASGAFPDGLTGIREVDAYVALWNPGGLRQQPSVWSPDLHRPHVQGGIA